MAPRLLKFVGVALLLFSVAGLSGCNEKDKEKPKTSQATSAPAAAAAPNAGWTRIEDDDVHDPANPEIKNLQNPGDALSELPRRGMWGNKVDWMASLQQGLIEPRAILTDKGKLPRIDIAVMMNMNGGQPVARFPHKQHTMWLDCGSCHNGLFEMKAGDTPVTMLAIMEGKFCGKCHGAVAFPVADCKRCHAVKHQDAFNDVKAGRCEQRKGKYRTVIVCPD